MNERRDLADPKETVARDQAVRPSLALPKQPPAGGPTGRPRLRVLLADDTSANRRVLTDVLTKRGHEVVAAQDGRQALDCFAAGKFDVVLLDARMPVMDGCRAAEAFRRLERGSGGHTPIIAITAHAGQGAPEECLEAGMDTWIAKPIDIRKLVELVEGCAAGRDRLAPAQDTQRTGIPAGDQDGSILDLHGTMQRLGGDLALLREFVVVFDEDSPGLMHTLHAAIIAGDGGKVERAAHSLRGLAANFGAQAVVDAASQLEKAGRSGQLRDAHPSYARLSIEVERLSRALGEYRD